MDQQIIGRFLKDLRKEKEVTQQQLAEIMGVSNRTVSRWETGINMPDLDVLIDIADYYEVDIRELLDGERKSERMNKDLEETIIKVADYSIDEKEKVTKRMNRYFLVGVLALIIYFVLESMGLSEEGYTGAIAGLSLGLSGGVLITGVIYTSSYMTRLKKFKGRIVRRQS